MTTTPGSADYWDHRYESIGATNVSWFQATPQPSLEAIAALGVLVNVYVVGAGFLLLGFGLVVMFTFYTGWGLYEILSMPQGTLP